MVWNMLNNLKRAEFFALIAAIFNGSIGVFTRFGFNSGLTPNTLAFWKCFGAFLLLETFARNSPFARGIPPNRKKTKNGNEISKTMAKSWIKSPNGC